MDGSYDSPYKFSGKELDVETGYNYFGARYYDSGLSVWLSVDPMSDKYPSTSPFMYVRGNPTMLIDPNGLWDQDADGNWTATKGDSWWSLHEESGMSWKETIAYAKEYNAARGQDNWKHVGVGDKVTLPGSGKANSSSLLTNTGESKPQIQNSGASNSLSASSLGSNAPNARTPDNTRGTIMSAANGIAALGPLGGMFDIGGVVDSYGNSRMYFTVGWAQGYGASGGMSIGKTNKNFRFADMEGLSSGWQVNAFVFSGEMFQDMQKTGTGTNYGNKMTYFGGGLGTLGFGGFHYFSTTFTVPVPTGEQLYRTVSRWH